MKKILLSTVKSKAYFHFLIMVLLFCSATVYSQDITITSLTVGVAGSPLIANTDDQAIFGFKLSKAGGGSNSVTSITITLSQNPASKITNARLYVSSDDDFDGIGSETHIDDGSFGATSITFTGSPITGFSGVSGGASRSYFVVVDIDPNVPGSATLQPSLTSGNVTINNDNISGSATGTNYTFTALETTITSLNGGGNNVASSPLVPGAAGQAVFGFALESNGDQTVSQLSVQLSSNPSSRLSNWSLVRSADADFSTANTTIGGLTFTPSSTELVITGLSEDVSTLQNYFLVADVAATPSGTIQASLGSSNVTVDQGFATGSATGTNYSFLTVDIGSLNAGPNNVALSPLVASSSGKAVFGFSLTGGGAQTVSQLNIQLSSNPASKLTNWSLVRSADTDFNTANTLIGGLTFTPSATELVITGLSEDVSTAQNYFLVADVDASVTGATGAIQASLGASDVTVDAGAVAGSATGTNYSFASLTTTIGSLNGVPNNVAASPLVSSSTGKAVFGFSLVSNGSQTATQLNIQLTSDPASKLANWSLVRSADTDFNTANTTIGGLTFTPSATELVITGLSEDVSTAQNYFLVADVDASVTGATATIRASLGSGNITLSAGSATGTSTGVVYSFAALTTTIGSLNAGPNNVAASPLVATTTGKAVFGFSLVSNGSQTATQLNIQLTSDPASKLANWSLVRSADTDFNTANTTIGGLTFTPSATELVITGLSENLSSAQNYFLVADVDASVTGVTATIRASLGSANITLSAGSATGTSTGVIYSFATLTTTIGSLNGVPNNVAASPLVATTTGKAVFGFSLVSNGSQTATQLNIQLTSDPASKLANWSLVRSADTDFNTANTTIGGLTFTPSATELVITGLSEDVSTAQNYFLVADVDASVTGATATISASLGSGNITLNAGSATGTSTGVVYSFAPLMASFTQINAGTAPVLLTTVLEAGLTGRVLTGFSATSNGSQEISAINFNISGLTTQFPNVYLYRSTTVGTVGTLLITDTNDDGNFDDFSAVAMGNKTITSTVTYYYLVVDVLNTATTATASVTVEPTEANISVTTGGKNPLSISRTFTFTQSFASDISLSGGNVADINITAANTADNPGDPVVTASSSVLATFSVRDGGLPLNDSDNLPTVLDQLTLQFENPANLDQIALFDQAGTKIVGTDKTPAASVVWTGLNYSTADGNSRNFTVRATFKPIVTDNQQTDVDVMATTSATSAGSLFAATNAGGNGTTATASHNRIEVQATKLVFVDPAALPIINTVTPYLGPEFAVVEGQPLDKFDATVAAVDANNNIDFDRTSLITLNVTPSGGGVNFKDSDNASTNPPTPLSLIAGIITFDNLTINLPNLYDVGSTGGGLTAASTGNGTALSIVIQTAGVDIVEANLSMCKSNSSGVYELLPDIILNESNNGDFDPGAGLSFLLILPSGWEFDTNETGDISYTPGRNISSANSTFTFLGNTIAKFNYSVSGTNQDDALTLENLYVRNQGGFDGVITRGGTGVIKGCCDDTKPLGTLTTTNSTIVDFSVESYPGQPTLPPATIKFPKTSAAIILNGELTPGVPDGTIGSFSGTSVTSINVPELSGNRYTFNPNILAAGNYFVTFSYADIDGCLSEAVKNFEVFEGAIDGLAPSYCADDITPQAISINASFIPTDAVVVDGSPLPGQQDAYSLRIPSQKYISEVVNNTGTLTVTVRNHGFSNGQQYWIYIANGFTTFSGIDAPYGYIYKLCTVSSATTDQFTIDVDVIGTWDNYYGVVYLPANYYNTFTGVANNVTSLTITAPDHGFLNGARPYIYIEFYNAGLGYYFVEGFFPIQSATVNTFNINVSVNPIYAWNNYGYAQSNWYRVTSFVPDVKLLNRKLVNVTTFDLGYFVKYNWCTGQGCDIYYTVHETPVQLYPLPIVSFSGLTNVYCDGDVAVSLTGSESATSSDGSFSISPLPEGTIADLGNGTATFDPGAQTYDIALDITYSYTDINGCTGSSTLPTIVRSKLVQPTAADTTFCQVAGLNDHAIAKARGVLAAQFNWYDNSSLTTLLATGETFDTNLPLSFFDQQSFFVTQVTPTSCESLPNEVVVTILQQPSAAITTNPATLCAGKEFFAVGPQNPVGPTPHPQYTWTFEFEPLDTIVYDNNTVPHIFTSAGSPKISLAVIDANGCTNSSTTIVGINDNPTPNFNYNKVCDQDLTEFHDITPGIDYAWKFYSGILPDTILLASVPRTAASTALASPFAGTAKDPIYELTQGANGPGDYTATVTAYNNIGCFSDLSKQITILEYLPFTTSSPYVMAAENGGDGYWKVGENSINSSWEFATPTTQNLDALGTDSWVTNAGGTYSASEHSILNSPCMDISGILRPTLTINFAMDTEPNKDGVVLEYSKDSGITWFSLGAVNSGINWFNTAGFATAPIGSSNIGWSGTSWGALDDNIESDTVVDVIRALDNIPNLSQPERVKVRFRLAFKTDSFDEREGFGFSNFRIETRNRLLLVENFTNQNDTQYGTNNTIFNAIDPLESVKIQYHVSSPPNGDPNSQINTADQSARAAYYGVVLTENNIPRAYLDGFSNGALVDPWYEIRKGKRSLVPAIINMTITSVPSPVDGYLKAQVTITSTQDIPDTLDLKPVVHIAIVEQVDGTNEFVLRKLFPSPIGIPLDLPLTQGVPVVIEDSVLVSNGMLPPDISLVAFIQDEISKNVFQSAIDLNPTNVPTPVTSTEDPAYAEKINLYPNPANQEVNIQLPAVVNRTTPVVLLDTYGRTVYENTFAPGDQSKKIPTTDMTSGIYIMQTITPDGKIARKKVMIMHQ